jgi:transposase
VAGQNRDEASAQASLRSLATGQHPSARLRTRQADGSDQRHHGRFHIGSYPPDRKPSGSSLFHVIRLASDALDELRRAQWQKLRETDPDRARWVKGTRFTLRRRSDRLSDGDQSILEQLAETNRDVYLGWLLLDQLRTVYLARDKQEALALLNEWIFAACVSKLEPFVRTALTIDTHRQQVVNAIALGLTNARLERMNSTVRLLSHRARGSRRLDSLLALITLVCSRVPVQPPT